MNRPCVIHGAEFDLDDVAIYMDSEIIEAVHADLSPCSPQEFVDEYLNRHLFVHGEEFDPREDWQADA